MSSPAQNRAAHVQPCAVHIYAESFAQVPASDRLDAPGLARTRRKLVGQFYMQAAHAALPWYGFKQWLPSLLENYVRNGHADENRAEARRRVEAAWEQGAGASLDLSNLGLRELPAVLPDVATLDVSNNRLATLTVLPCALEVLRASDNDLRRLPSLPPRLRALYVDGNALTRLPSPLPISLWTLDADRNALDDLPAAPEALLHLRVAENRGRDLAELAEQRLREAARLRAILLPNTSLGLNKSVSALLPRPCPARLLEEQFDQAWRASEKGRIPSGAVRV
jgi:hypothetical protein